MIKDFLRGLTIGVGILFVFSVVGLVYAVGFHIADEVQSGTFGGDYEFVGDVDFTSANVVGLPESGINVSFADARYVNAAGDTVNGNLRIDGAITNAVGTIRDNNGGWVRTYGNTGWYSQTHGGGWYMVDSTYIRNYGSKQVYLNNNLYAPIMYDQQNAAWYVDPASTSRQNIIRAASICDENGANCKDVSAGWSSGTVSVNIYQCPVGTGGWNPGGLWGSYGCQGQISSASTCQNVEFPHIQNRACTYLGRVLIQ